MKAIEGFKRSYWAVPEKILVGCYPGDLEEGEAARKLGGLLDAGVTLVINLMEEDEKDRAGNGFRDYQPLLYDLARKRGCRVRMERFAVVDLSVPSPEGMRKILAAIGGEINGGGKVFVHCWGGKGRTGTVTGCWLLQEGVVGPDQIFEHLRKLTAHEAGFFRPTPQTKEQEQFVCSWKKAPEIIE